LRGAAWYGHHAGMLKLGVVVRAANGNDLVYSYRATASGMVTVTLAPEASFDAVLIRLEGTCAPMACIQALDMASSGGVETLFTGASRLAWHLRWRCLPETAAPLPRRTRLSLQPSKCTTSLASLSPPSASRSRLSTARRHHQAVDLRLSFGNSLCVAPHRRRTQRVVTMPPPSSICSCLLLIAEAERCEASVWPGQKRLAASTRSLAVGAATI
jgi:hypothetical protein